MWSSSPGILPIYGLATLGLLSSVAADYYVDNANDTVAYAASGTSWRTFSFATQNLTLVLSDGNVTVDSSKCYDGNYALAACAVDNNCQITIPFTGSGISVYVMQAGFQGITASLTIDGGQSVTATLPPPVPPSYQTPNVSLFDLQLLPSADHTATINLLDWDNGATSLYFDYALINESYVELPVSSPTSSSSSSSTTTPTDVPTSSTTAQPSTTQPTTASSTSVASAASSTSSSAFIGSTYTSGATSALSNTESSVNLGAVVGGACGGFAVLIAIATAIIFLKKRKSRQIKLEESRKPDPFPATPTLSHDQIASLIAHPPMDEKARMRLAARNAAVYPSDGESSDFHILSAVGSAGRTPSAGAGSSNTDPFLLDDFVIDCRREGGSSSSFRDSAVRNTPPPTTLVDSAPPGYQTLEESRRSNASL